MKRISVLFRAAALCAGLLALTCSKNSSPTDPGNLSATWTYTVDGNNIIITHPQVIETECDSTDQLVADTTPAYTDTNWYVLSDGNDTLYVQGDYPGDTTVLVRIGDGTGLEGEWRMAITDSISATITVTATTITASACFTDMFMAVWAPLYEAFANVTVSQSSCATVVILGNVTGEMATVSFSQSGNAPDNMAADMTFTSNNVQHQPPGTVYANPTSCPNDGPDWMLDFLFSNMNVYTPKKTALPAVTFPKLRLFK
jgi:hypothetical protein